MVFMTPVMLTSHFTLASTLVPSLATTVTKNFFMQLFLNPGDNFIAVLIVCGVVVAPCVGLIFLIKKLYEKYTPERR